MQLPLCPLTLVQALLAKVLPMLLVWPSQRSIWLLVSTNQAVRLLTTTRNNTTIDLFCPVFSSSPEVCKTLTFLADYIWYCYA